MTFKDVVIKNFKYNLKTYGSFFICSTFTITLFFIFTTLFYNNKVTAFLKNGGSGSKVTIYIALYITFIFAIFFISYVHNSMKKSRSKEFGLLMTLGMTTEDLSRGVIIEDIILSSASFISGVFTGTLFSRLVHMFINRLLDLQVPYDLSYKSFALTLCAFFIIFALVILWGWINMRRLDISKLLGEQRKTEYIGNGNTAALITGAAMVIFLVVIGIIAINNRDIALNFNIILPSVMLGIAGTYIVIANIIPKILYFIKKRNNFYNKNMIMLAEAKYSIGKNKKLIFMSAVLYTVIIFSFSSCMGIYSIISSITDKDTGADIEYIQTADANNIKEQDIIKLINKEKLALESEQHVNCLLLSVNGIHTDYKLPLVAVSNSTFNRLSNKKTDVPEGKVRLSGDAINIPKVQGNSINIQNAGKNLKLSVLDSQSLCILSLGMYPQYEFTLILNDEDYLQLQKSLPQNMAGIINKYKFSDWRNTKNIIDKVSALSEKAGSPAGESAFGKALSVTGRYYRNQFNKKLSSMNIFIFVFLSFLFYIASVLMLFLRQFESLDRVKKKYNQLRKIGITDKEFGKSILGETRIIFLTPVFFGIILGYSFMLIVESMVGGADFVSEFMKNAAIMTAAYIILQIIACELSGRKFLNKVTEA